MKRGVSLLATLTIVLVACGVLTAGVWGGLPTLEQTSDPSASFFQTTPGQAAQLFIWIMIVMGGLIANGVFIAGLFWWLNHEVKVVEQHPTRSQLAGASTSQALPENAS